jgi:electron transfer flavoprotein alpha subunit
MKVLVFLEHNGKELLKGPLGVLGRAATLGADEVAAVLIGGSSVGSLASEAGRFGAGKVYLAEGEDLDAPLPQPRIDVLERVVTTSGCDTVLFSNSVLTADVAAGLAARLDADLNWDLVDILQRDGALVGKRLVFQDSALVEVGWRSGKKIALFRPGSFDPVAGDAVEPEVERVTVELREHSRRATLVSQSTQGGGGASFDDANVIVAGGMGLGAPENFSLAESLATVLGGAVGATRAAVYAGWYPRSAQIGQTGRTVSPNLYVALGISGAVQHKVGMQGSKTIVAINKDPNAPIFEVCDLAVVGDVEAIVPRLTDLLRQRTGR